MLGVPGSTRICQITYKKAVIICMCPMCISLYQVKYCTCMRVWDLRHTFEYLNHAFYDLRHTVKYYYSLHYRQRPLYHHKAQGRFVFGYNVNYKPPHDQSIQQVYIKYGGKNLLIDTGHHYIKGRFLVGYNLNICTHSIKE